MTLDPSMNDSALPFPRHHCCCPPDEESDDEEDTVDAAGVGAGVKKELIPFAGPCNLPYRTQLMIKLIFSDDMFVSQMSSMNIGQ